MGPHFLQVASNSFVYPGGTVFSISCNLYIADPSLKGLDPFDDPDPSTIFLASSQLRPSFRLVASLIDPSPFLHICLFFERRILFANLSFFISAAISSYGIVSGSC